MIDFENPVLEFTANDRCDGCGAQAYYLAYKDGFAELLFCFHHHQRSADALLTEGWMVVEDSEAVERLFQPATQFAG